MKTTHLLIGRITAALALTALLATPAAATTSGLCRLLPVLCKVTPPKTPEIDPGLARGTLTLLVGGVLMLAERRRR